MVTIPVMSGREIVEAFKNLGWKFDRQNGSHIVLMKEEESASLCIPNKENVPSGTIRGLIRAANLTVPKFMAAIATV